MDDNRTDPEKVTAQAAGLERFLRTRLLNTMTRLFLVLVLVGGLFTAVTPESHMLETASICLVVAVGFATWFIVHFVLLNRGLHTDPERVITHLHKKRSFKKAGYR
jgi:hypothetical protein